MRPRLYGPLEIGIHGVLILCPLLFGSASPTASMLLAAILFFLFFLYPKAFEKISDLPPAFFWGNSAVLLFLILGYFTSMNAYATGRTLLLWAAAAAAFLLILHLPRESGPRLLKTIVGMACLETLYGVYQVSSGHEMALGQKKIEHLGFVTGTYLNRNHLAAYLAMAAGIQAGFLKKGVETKNQKTVIFLICSLGLTLFGLVKTGSRAALASLVLSYSFFSLLEGMRKKTLSRAWRFCLIFLGIAFFAGACGVLLMRFRSLDIGDPLAWSGARFKGWADAFQILVAHPFLGIGLGSFKWVFPFYQSETLMMGWAHIHNDYLELAIELGLPGFFILLFSFAALFQFCLKGIAGDSEFPALIWGNLVALGAFCIHGMTDFNFAMTGNLLTFMFLAAMTLKMALLVEKIKYEE